MTVKDCRFIFDNFIRSASAIDSYANSEHPQWPVEYMADDALVLPWRSRHGTGTGNGVFVASAVSNKINFDEGGAELTATLTNNAYNGQTWAAQAQAQLNATGALTYTVTYSEATGKFTIAATGNFTLRFNTGTNKAASVAGQMGFLDTANKTGAATYTSDLVVIHYMERPRFDLGAAREYNAIALLNHNLTASAVVTITGSDDEAIATNNVADVLTYNGNNIFAFLTTARTKRYIQLGISDPTNPSGYVQFGAFVVGKYLQTSRPFGPYAEGEIDESEVEHSPSSNLFTLQERPPLVNRELSFKGLDDASAAGIRSMLATNGIRKALWLCTDSTAPNSSSYWMRLKEPGLPQYHHIGNWSWDATLEAVL